MADSRKDLCQHSRISRLCVTCGEIDEAVAAENKRCADRVCQGCKYNIELSGDYYHLYPTTTVFCQAAVFVRREDNVG